MATIEGISAAFEAIPQTPKMPPIPPDPPDIHKGPSHMLTTKSKDKDMDLTMNSHNCTNKLKVLFVKDIHLECNYNIIAASLGRYGRIKEIKMKFNEVDLTWEAWIVYDRYEAAFNACKDISNVLICNSNVKGSLTDNTPKNLESYKPSEWESDAVSDSAILERVPQPPTWIVVTAKEEKYNYYRLSKHLQKLVGGIKSGDISRFGKGRVLIHTRSKTQSVMLSHANVQNDTLIKEIRPHINFSYGRGVIFDKDLYDFEEHEILNMCPPSVYKVRKVPNTSMTILTFQDDNVPTHIIIENERVKIRPFSPKPLQCFNCFGFGHPSNACRNSKICNNCSKEEHGMCESAPKCKNCQQDHKSTDKRCEVYKDEAAALCKANAEHITVGYAKRLLGQGPSYARVLRNPSTITTKVQTSAPTAGGGAVASVVMTQSSESHTTPAGVEVTPLSVALLPTGRRATAPKNIPPHHVTSPIIQVAPLSDSLPDLMSQEQGCVPKRVRTPSHSPPHVRQKCSSPQGRSENKTNVNSTRAEVHPSSKNKKDEKNQAKNKPSISRKSNERSNK